MEKIIYQLNQMNIKFNKIEKIQSKDGIFVYRVFCDTCCYVLKYFAKQDYRRELSNYQLLKSLGIQTLNIISSTDKSLLMEDIQMSDTYRLATAKDLDNVKIAKNIAVWYKNLHSIKFQSDMFKELYCETDVITKQNTDKIAIKTKTTNNPVWKVVKDNFEIIINKINRLPKVITYNDFYYTNLIVAKDNSSAFMFDYNLLGKNYIYADIRNVTYSLSKKAKIAFLDTYGYFNANEKIVDDVASLLVSLHIACEQEHIPNWANNYIRDINNGEFFLSVERLLNEVTYEF